MKNRVNAIILLSLILSSYYSFAQKAEGEIVFSANAGISLMQSVVATAENADEFIEDSMSISASSIPALQTNLDFGITEHFSFGIGISYQTLSIDYEYNDQDFEDQNFSVDFTRINLGVKPLFHYGGESDILDMYSGLRIGYRLNKVTVTNNDSYDEANWEPIFPISFQLVVWGMRFYPTERIGFNMEVALGAPHYLSGGISYRLQ